MRKYYIKFLQYLCKRELRTLSNMYPNTLEELIIWHDFMAIETITKNDKKGLLGICVQTSNALEILNKKEEK
jgi:hypothetical protein